MIGRIVLRIVLCAVVFAVISLIVIGFDSFLMIGLLTGSLISIGKNTLYGMVPLWLAQQEHKISFRALSLGLLSQMITIALLLAAVIINERLFYGAAAGLITSPVSACVAAIVPIPGLRTKCERYVLHI